MSTTTLTVTAGANFPVVSVSLISLARLDTGQVLATSGAFTQSGTTWSFTFTDVAPPLPAYGWAAKVLYANGQVKVVRKTTGFLSVNVAQINNVAATPLVPPIAVTVSNQGNSATSIIAIGTSNSTTFTGAAIGGSLNYPFSWRWTYSGMDLTGWTQVVFTAKAKQADADSAAILTIQLSNPAAGPDGLTRLNGAATSGSTTAADGNMTVAITPASGTVPVQSVVTAALTARGMAISAEQTLFWETTWYLAGVKQPPLDGGTFSVAPSVRANPVAS